jgi:hypothetical protein
LYAVDMRSSGEGRRLCPRLAFCCLAVWLLFLAPAEHIAQTEVSSGSLESVLLKAFGPSQESALVVTHSVEVRERHSPGPLSGLLLLLPVGISPGVVLQRGPNRSAPARVRLRSLVPSVPTGPRPPPITRQS